MRRLAAASAGLAATVSLAVAASLAVALPAQAEGPRSAAAAVTTTATGIGDIRIAVEQPRWAFDRHLGRATFTLKWHYTVPPPAGMDNLHFVVVDQENHMMSPREGGGSDWLDAGTATSVQIEKPTMRTDGFAGLRAGSYYRFCVYVKDDQDNYGVCNWSPNATYVPLDDVAKHNGNPIMLTPYDGFDWGHGWKLKRDKRFYYGSAHTTTRKTTMRTVTWSVWGKRAVLIGTTCAHCGKLRLKIEAGPHSTRYYTVDTYSKHTKRRQVLWQRLMAHHHLTELEVTTKATPGRPRVTIDGYAVTE